VKCGVAVQGEGQCVLGLARLIFLLNACSYFWTLFIFKVSEPGFGLASRTNLKGSDYGSMHLVVEEVEGGFRSKRISASIGKSDIALEAEYSVIGALPD